MKKVFCAAFIIISFSGIRTACANFVVDPSFISSNAVTLGSRNEIAGEQHCFLAVHNADDRPAAYRVQIISCKQDKRSPRFGYEEFPKEAFRGNEPAGEIKWISLKSHEMIVPAKATGSMRDVYIEIPKKKEYYGKKYQAIVKVTQEAAVGQPMNLEVVLPLFIETEKK